jgi:hypothetical protein
VTVNGVEARALAANFAEWEVTLTRPADGRLTARAEDAAGNVEPRPHTVALGPGSRFRPVAARREAAPARVGALARGRPGLDGRWRVESQQRAGRKTERWLNMILEFAGNRIWMYTTARPAGGRKEGPRRVGLPITCRLRPGSPAGAIDLDGPLRGTSRGLHRLEGDTLTLCLSPTFAVVPDYDHNETAGEVLLNQTAEAARAIWPIRPARISREAGTLIVLRRLTSP